MKTAYISSGRDRKRQCAVCLVRFDAVTCISVPPDGEKPKSKEITPTPGALTICAYCGAILVFTRKNCRVATQEEYDALDDDIKAIVSEWQQWRETHVNVKADQWMAFKPKPVRVF